MGYNLFIIYCMLFKEIKLDFFERKLVDGNKVLIRIRWF